MNKICNFAIFVFMVLAFAFATVSRAAAAAASPESCQDIRDANPAAPDGGYVIYPNNQVFTVYCHDMSGTPREYLSLANTGGSSNFSQYTAGGAGWGTDAITRYTKVRLNPNTLLVDVNDKTFSTSTGSIYHGGFLTDTDYATAMDCVSGGSSSGQGNVDLRGTPFAVVDTFAPDGYIPAGSAAFSSDDQVVDLQGGGYCGWISPARRPAHDPIDNAVAYVLSLRYKGPTADAGGPYLVAIGEQIAFDGSLSSDPDDDTLSETWTAAGGSVSGSSYTAGTVPGIYEVALVVNDGAFDSAPAETIVVAYDPNGGFITGGGWIDSPAGAFKDDEALTGKASFGFVAKYQKGANVPSGNTEFQFKAGDLNFRSTSYEWLVVAGNKAQFRGAGAINGAGSYTFVLSADDDSPDTFRIQIWGDTGTVYDNGSQQALDGGSIKVHSR